MHRALPYRGSPSGVASSGTQRGPPSKRSPFALRRASCELRVPASHARCRPTVPSRAKAGVLRTTSAGMQRGPRSRVPVRGQGQRGCVCTELSEPPAHVARPRLRGGFLVRRENGSRRGDLEGHSSERGDCTPAVPGSCGQEHLTSPPLRLGSLASGRTKSSRSLEEPHRACFVSTVKLSYISTWKTHS